MIMIICDECREPATEPVDGNELDLCARCSKSMAASHAGSMGQPWNALGWTDGVHYTIDGPTYHCKFCPRSYQLWDSMRKHLGGKHRDQVP